ncbi:MAG: hypothetical protein HKN23_04295 [Verrucomicrobiales bacterium]|nr:hypothetical protein [Verrucomicrobiales bacterium]
MANEPCCFDCGLFKEGDSGAESRIDQESGTTDQKNRRLRLLAWTGAILFLLAGLFGWWNAKDYPLPLGVLLAQPDDFFYQPASRLSLLADDLRLRKEAREHRRFCEYLDLSRMSWEYIEGPDVPPWQMPGTGRTVTFTANEAIFDPPIAGPSGKLLPTRLSVRERSGSGIDLRSEDGTVRLKGKMTCWTIVGMMVGFAGPDYDAEVYTLYTKIEFHIGERPVTAISVVRPSKLEFSTP